MSLAHDQIPPPAQPAQKMARQHRSWASFRVITALMLREVATRYGTTPGGYIWAFAEPMGAIAIMSVAFSLLMRSPHLGDSFILYYATGYLPFQLFSNVSNQVARSMSFAGPLLRYPAVTWVDALAARALVNAMTTILVAFILFIVIFWLTGSHLVIAYQKVFLSFFMALVIGLGVGVFNAVLFGLFPVYDRIWGVATRPLFIASAILFLYEELPAVARDYLWYNPLVHVTGMSRDGFFAIYQPTYISVSYALGFGMITLVLGLVMMGRFYKDIINK